MNTKKELEHDRNDKEKIYVACFVREMIGNRLSCRQLYEFVEGVIDFWVIILPKN